MFHTAPTLMFIAILLHDACGSPRGLESTSIFEPRSYAGKPTHVTDKQQLLPLVIRFWCIELAIHF